MRRIYDMYVHGWDLKPYYIIILLSCSIPFYSILYYMTEVVVKLWVLLFERFYYQIFLTLRKKIAEYFDSFFQFHIWNNIKKTIFRSTWETSSFFWSRLNKNWLSNTCDIYYVVDIVVYGLWPRNIRDVDTVNQRVPKFLNCDTLNP